MTVTESPFDYTAYEAAHLTMLTLEPGVTYTLVRNNDSSDHGVAELFFADPNAAERYITRVKAAHASGALGEPHFHPQPPSLNLMVFTVARTADCACRNKSWSKPIDESHLPSCPLSRMSSTE